MHTSLLESLHLRTRWGITKNTEHVYASIQNMELWVSRADHKEMTNLGREPGAGASSQEQL